MEDTVFAKIIRREIPAHIVYEDEHTLAFLDRAPNAIGHTLVIPKKPIVNIFDADDETLAHIMHTVRIIAPRVCAATGAKGVHIYSNHNHEGGQEVFHFHFHIIPRVSRDDYEFCWDKLEPSEEEQAALAARMREA